jgi:hypothetical protein
LEKGFSLKVYDLATFDCCIPLCMKEFDLCKAKISEDQAKNQAEQWKLLDHPNIVKLLSWNCDNSLFCTICENLMKLLSKI